MASKEKPTQRVNKKLIISFLITILLIAFLYLSNLGFGTATTLIVTIVVLVIAYIEHKNKIWSSLGFSKKHFNYKNILIKAPLTAVLIVVMYTWLLTPIITSITKVEIDLSAFDFLKGNLSNLLVTLPLVWISAAFGEEIIFRGYLMTRFSTIFGKSTLSILLNIILFSVFFGYIHNYQGLTGQLLSGTTGAILAIIFHFNKNNLWFNIIVHGTIDTIALVSIYFNLL